LLLGHFFCARNLFFFLPFRQRIIIMNKKWLLQQRIVLARWWWICSEARVARWYVLNRKYQFG
jgi:hypothetical protein